jgi:hypothetical protein
MGCTKVLFCLAVSSSENDSRFLEEQPPADSPPGGREYMHPSAMAGVPPERELEEIPGGGAAAR